MREVLLDANAMIDLMALSCLHAVPGCPGLRFWVVENVQRRSAGRTRKRNWAGSSRKA